LEENKKGNKTNNIIEVLNLFNEKADEIKNSSYAKFLLVNTPKTIISKKQGDPLRIEKIEPDEESFRICLILRTKHYSFSTKESYIKIYRFVELLDESLYN